MRFSTSGTSRSVASNLREEIILLEELLFGELSDRISTSLCRKNLIDEVGCFIDDKHNKMMRNHCFHKIQQISNRKGFCTEDEFSEIFVIAC